MNKLLALWILFASTAYADEVVIHTSIGDHVSEFSIKSSIDQYDLTLLVNNVKKRGAEIGKKNYDYSIRKTRALLDSMKSSTACENRDSSYLEIRAKDGKNKRVDFCFTDRSKENDQLRHLVNTLLMALY